MPISTKTLIDRINDKISDPATSAADIIKMTSAVSALQSALVFTVDTEFNLPPAELNEGRLIFIKSLANYRYSDGLQWTVIGNSVPPPIATLRTWGANNTGQLGDNTIVNKSSPVSVVGGFTDWCQVSSGNGIASSAHTAALRTNGTLWTWGVNACGQLGDNTIVNKSSPVSVVGGFTDWCQVSAGTAHTAAIRTNGTLWTWGSNNCGGLGHNTATTCSRSSPVSVVGGFTDWCQVSASRYQTAAIRTNGTLWTWGWNYCGLLGDNTVIDKSSPVSVVGGFTDWCQVSSNNVSTAAIRTNGTLWSWGGNYRGRLGDNTTVAKSSPVIVVGGFTDWCRVSMATAHGVALRTNGTIWTWGQGTSGILGDNTTVDKSSPVSVVGGFTDWVQVSASLLNTVAIRSNGTLWTWGTNSYGQLGDNTVVAKSSPVSVVGGFTGWGFVAAGYQTAGIVFTG